MIYHNSMFIISKITFEIVYNLRESFCVFPFLIPRCARFTSLQIGGLEEAWISRQHGSLTSSISGMCSVRLSTSRLYLHATILDLGKRIELETTCRANSQSPRDNPKVCLFKARDVSRWAHTWTRSRKETKPRHTIETRERRKKEAWKDRYLRAL